MRNIVEIHLRSFRTIPKHLNIIYLMMIKQDFQTHLDF